jgi:lipid II:glycine glycyltransferase (peptidoglycan interpeptide bridge formation enzyme)
VARHGLAATYLIGWSGQQGRAANAANLLLWRAVLGEKTRGARFFDLGGIDSRKTLGVASFKSGIRGEPYEQSGEYWRV